MNVELRYKKEESYGILEIDPCSESEYYALSHWLNHAIGCGLSSHMIKIKVPSWLIKEVKIEEVFEYIETKCNLWDTDDIRGSSETKSGDKWLSMNIVEKVKKRFIKEVMEES